MTVTWWQPVTITGPEGWTRLALGDLSGAAVWCGRCRAHTDHNAAHHDRYRKDAS